MLVKKGIAIILFLLVSAGFLYGFISYNRRLSKMMNQEIEQADASKEPYDEIEEQGDTEKPVSAISPETNEETAQSETLRSIPNILGLSEEEAVIALEEAKLVPEIHLEYIDDVEKGFVFYQRPPMNQEVPEGTVISFSVSRGPYGSSGTISKVKVPALVGKTETEARNLLEGLKLKMKSLKVHSDTINSGLIITQDIPSGRAVDEGSAVSVQVSIGKELVLVPSVVNLKEAEAASQIETKGLKFSVNKQYSDKAQGIVISQSQNGIKVPKGTLISLTVSRGPKPSVPIPDPVVPEPDPDETDPDPVLPDETEPDPGEPEPDPGEPEPDSGDPNEGTDAP